MMVKVMVVMMMMMMLMLTSSPGPEDDLCRLRQLMSDIGGPLKKLKPEQILLVARAGSYMYNLSTPDSDVDYTIVYRDDTQVRIGDSCRLLYVQPVYSRQ